MQIPNPSAHPLTVQHLNLWLGNRQILHDISLSLAQGDMVMLLGANGAGKTQLMKSILGLQRHTTGEIWVEGRNLAQLSAKERAKLLAYVPQVGEMGLRFRVLEFVLMGAVPQLMFHQAPSQAMVEQAKTLLQSLGVLHLMHRFMDEISGGEAKLCYLARALLQDTPWLMMDEPTAALDFAKQHQFLQLVQQTVTAHGKGALITIHEPSIALRYANVLILLQNGRILDTIRKTESMDCARLTQGLCAIYGENITLEDTTVGKTVIWRERSI